jgi:hypothetical protein
MSQIIIGKSGNKNLALNLDALLRGRMLVQANSGKGKSWLLRRLAEQLFGKVQVIIIDPEGEFATLREKFGYVLVGKGGETPADPRSAGLVAHKLLELRASAVCDLYEMKVTARHEWVKKFLEAAVEAPKNLWHPCVIVIDEAHVFCPEKGFGESEASEAVIGLATRGRKRGYTCILATQRLGKLAKDAAAELLNVLIGGTFIDIDRKRAADALGYYGKDKNKFFDEIKMLEAGKFFALGAALSTERVLVTIGPVETTHPEAGSARHAAEPPPAPEQIAKMLPKLADLPKAAEEKAKTEAELRAEIRSLKAQVRSATASAGLAGSGQKVQPTAADPKAIERAVRPLRELLRDAMKIIVKVEALGDFTGLKEEETASLIEAVKREVRKLANEKLSARDAELKILRREANRLSSRLKQILDESHDKIQIDVSSPSKVSGGEIQKGGKPSTSQTPRPERGTTPASHAYPRPDNFSVYDERAASTARTRSENNGDLSRPQKAILRAIAEFEAIGRSQISKSWIAARAGASYTSSSFGNNLSYLKSNGYIVYPGRDQASLTDKGRECAGEIEPPETSEELLESCLKLVTRPQQAILKVLYEKYPEPVDKNELAGLAGASATSSSFGNNVSALKSAGMIEYPGAGKAKCADWLFLD